MASAARSVQYEAQGLKGLGLGDSGMNHVMNNTSNTINGTGPVGREQPQIDRLMQPIDETAADAQDEYEMSKSNNGSRFR